MKPVTRRWPLAGVLSAMVWLVVSACSPAITLHDAQPETGAGLPDASAPDAHAPPEVRVLFIGNSYTAYHDLPLTVANLGRTAPSPVRFVVKQHTPGGHRWRNHDANPVVDTLIAEGWHFVVLQDQSSQPFAPGHLSGLVNSSLVSLGKKARAAGATPTLFMTWARATQPSIVFDQNVAVNRYYETNAAAVSGLVAPVGRAWERALQTPGVVLHAPDGSHPTPEGSYLAACVIHATLTGKSPLGLGDGGMKIAPDRVAALQRFAAETLAVRGRFPALPLLARWPLSRADEGQDILFSRGVSVGDMRGPDGRAGGATRFGEGKQAMALYFDGIDPPATTLAFHAHRADWSQPLLAPEHLFALAGRFGLYQAKQTLIAEVDGLTGWRNTLVFDVSGLSPGWHRFVLTADTTRHTLWIDGRERATAQISTPVRRSAPPGIAISIPRNVAAPRAPTTVRSAEFSGGLARIKLYRGVLTPAQSSPAD